MTPQEGLAHFAALAPSNIKMGLERVRTAVAKLGNPEKTFPALHVAGTNGKGSTCAIAESCLRQRYKTGLYTSPHLIRPNERIQVNGVEIDDVTFGGRIAEVLEVLGVDHELTYFEFGTIVAFWHFAKERVDIGVIETGLGGRLDATTACNAVVTCITPIDFDHMEYLGNTLAKIAGEKAGIFKPGVPIVLAAQKPEALAVLDRPGAKLEGRDFQINESPLSRSRERVGGRVADIDSALTPNPLPQAGEGVYELLKMKGAHQRQNLEVALACLRELKAFPLTDDQLRAGISAARWPGRLEEFPGTPLVVLDGAHNPAGVSALLAALDDEYAGHPVHLVFGVFADKDSEPMMRALFPRAEALYLTPLSSPRSKNPASYVEFARTLNSHVSVHADAPAALTAAKAEAPANAVVICAGSLHLVGELRAILLR